MDRQSFKPTDRLRARAEFLRVQRSGKKLVTPSLLLFVSTASETNMRLGITVSRRVGGAVERNRVKRLLREVFRRNKPMFPERTDIVVVAKPEARRLDYDSLRAEIATALGRAKR